MLGRTTWLQPASENARKLAALISDELKISIESANSDKKSANKSADSNMESADSMTVLTKRQEQILTIMEDGREYQMQKQCLKNLEIKAEGFFCFGM